LSSQEKAPARFAKEARKGRRRLYPVTVVYTTVTTLALGYGLASNAAAAATSWVLGLLSWTWLEYITHRYLLHGTFPDGPGLQHLVHAAFDHHKRPWDGSHINGTLKDSWFIVFPLLVGSLLFPPWSLTPFLAGLFQAGIVEEWVHHSVHYYHFDNLYFRYIKRHHMYHHSPKGEGLGYGLTSGFWDRVYGTCFPAEVRQRLYTSLRRDAGPAQRIRT
jgi:sterol desaturase/sphingolipid hydroxylase (fatty acid hydroxylase superfamily)